MRKRSKFLEELMSQTKGKCIYLQLIKIEESGLVLKLKIRR